MQFKYLLSKGLYHLGDMIRLTTMRTKDKINPEVAPQYGKLYKLENESLVFRYIYCRGDDKKGIHRFKHHQLKEYLFNDFCLIEREANKEEIRVYNLIKDHINDIADKTTCTHYN